MPEVKKFILELSQWETKHQSELPDSHTHLIRTLILWGLDKTYFFTDKEKSVLFTKNDFRDIFPLFIAFLYCDQKDLLKKSKNIPTIESGLERILSSIFTWFPFDTSLDPKFLKKMILEKTLLKDIEKIFTELFAILEKYAFILDENKNEIEYITPIVFAHFVENKIDQRAYGVYFTNRDITDFMTQKTILGYLFVRLQKLHLLQNYLPILINKILKNPENYFFPVYFHGYDKKYPPTISEGLDNISKRDQWQTITPNEWSILGEIWRETIDRHQKIGFWLHDLKNTSDPIDILLCGNIDLLIIFQEIINSIDSGWELLIIAQEIKSMRILDPTCGAGDFLISTANLLVLLSHWIYERMIKIDSSLIPKLIGEYYFYHNALLSKEDAREVAIITSIIETTLFGIDLHPQAVANAKLRLFLLICSRLNNLHFSTDQPKWKSLTGINFIHFDLHILIGNSLIGSIARDCLPSNAWKFGFAEDELKDDLYFLLNSTLLPPVENPSQIKPFHWSLDFYSEIQSRGFDIIIGNPPYLEAKEVDYSIRLYNSKDLNLSAKKTIHALCVERALQLLRKDGAISMIIPMALISTQRMRYLQNLLEEKHSVWYANFAWRPGKLFEDVNRALTIFISLPMGKLKTYSTGYLRWYANNSLDLRPSLFQNIPFNLVPQHRDYFFVPKFAQKIDSIIFEQMITIWGKSRMESFIDKSPNSRNLISKLDESIKKQIIYYRSTGGLYWKIFTTNLPKFEQSEGSKQSSRTQTILIKDEISRDAIVAVLNSDFFWWWYSISSNLRDLNPWDIENFPITSDIGNDAELAKLGQNLMSDIEKNSEVRTRRQSLTGKGENRTQHFIMKKSKLILNQIDYRLAKLFGFSPDILDYIQNYDIKYRMDLLNRENQGL